MRCAESGWRQVASGMRSGLFLDDGNFMNVHPFDLLALPQKGAGLLLTPCPGTRGVEAGQSLDQLKAAGASALITLMPKAEMLRNGVADLDEWCAERGLSWFHLPIEDERAPADDFRKAWKVQRTTVHELLDAGRVIAIHCKGGSGRTGLMAAQILVERGATKEQASAAVRSLRPNALQLPVHQDYLAGLTVSESRQPG